MFVEVERARLSKQLASMHEAKGEISEARKIMQDTTVDTLGGMDRREKTEFILEQVWPRGPSAACHGAPEAHARACLSRVPPPKWPHRCLGHTAR